jgi:predicted lactoylglutathione lyase
MDVGEYGCGYGRDGFPAFWVSTFSGVGPNREVHIAFQAADAAAVRAFYETALATGAESLHPPRLWPEYHPGYYGAFVRDLEGNNVEAVCHRAGPED